MKTWKKVLCLVLAILLLILAGLIIWQRDNIGSMILYLKTDSQEISAQKYQLNEDHRAELEELTGEKILVSLPSSEQCESLLNGETTSEQIKGELGLDPGQTPETPDTLGSILNACAAELAGYKVDVMAKLGAAKADVLAQWTALPPEEQTSSKKTALVLEGLETCYHYEAEVDEAVQACLDRYRAQLEAIGQDPAVMDLFWKQYCDEKQTEKAFYIDKYLN